jgi:hypothetical protein
MHGSLCGVRAKQHTFKIIISSKNALSYQPAGYPFAPRASHWCRLTFFCVVGRGVPLPSLKKCERIAIE